MNAAESYLAWACADCFGKYFIIGFKHGVTVDRDLVINRTTKLTTTIGGTAVTLLERAYSKEVHTFHEFFRQKGVAPNGPIDTTYVSYIECGGEPPDKNTAEYSVSSDFINTQIYFADLRNDILVYYTEEGGSQTSGSGNAPMGIGLGYGGWQGGDPACKSVNTLDAIKMPVSVPKNITKKEIITLGNYEPFNYDNTETSTFAVAAVTGAPTCGGVSDECVHWGEYDRIDQSKPYSCAEGEFVNEVEVEAITAYLNSWDYVGSWSDIDSYDRSQWIGNFKDGYDGAEFVGRIEDGTYPYPSFFRFDVLPHGSWAVDAEGNYFHSMITKDLQVFNKLNEEEPNVYAELPGDNVVFYPVGVA